MNYNYVTCSANEFVRPLLCVCYAHKIREFQILFLICPHLPFTDPVLLPFLRFPFPSTHLFHSFTWACKFIFLHCSKWHLWRALHLVGIYYLSVQGFLLYWLRLCLQYIFFISHIFSLFSHLLNITLPFISYFCGFLPFEGNPALL